MYNLPVLMRVTILTALLVAFLSGLGLGCKPHSKDAEDRHPEKRVEPGPSMTPVASFYWAGKEKVLAGTNASTLIDVWKLPESKGLEEQTLTKLAAAPFGATNSELLKPLFRDLLDSEVRVEVASVSNSNQSASVTLKVKLNETRQAVWKSNLHAIAQSATLLLPSGERTNDWLISGSNRFKRITLTGEGEFLQVMLSTESKASALEQGTSNTLPIAVNIDTLFSANVLPKGLAQAFGVNADWLRTLSKVEFSAVGEGENVVSRGSLLFEKPLGIQLEPWNIPTNLIHDPLTSFTAVRGLKELLERGLWPTNRLGQAPNQAFVWSQDGTPLLSFAAAPSANASNSVSRLVEEVLLPLNRTIDTNLMGGFEITPGQRGVHWVGSPFLSPYVTWTTDGYIFSGLLQLSSTNSPVPDDLLTELQSRSNLMFYAWEATDSMGKDYLYLGQLLRLILKRQQLPADGAGIKWLRASGSRLKNCVTVLTLVDQQHIEFVQQGGIGLSAMELHAFVDWLESPDFSIRVTSMEPAISGERAKSKMRP